MSSEPLGVQSSDTPEPPPAGAPEPKRREDLMGFVFLGITALFFGAAPTFARLAFDGGIDALSLQVFRFAIAFVCVTATMALIREMPRIDRGLLLRLLLLAFCTGFASFCYMTSVRYVSVAVASLTFFTFPLLVGPLSHIFGLERLTPRFVIATVVAFAGLCLVLGGDIALDWIGVIMAFSAGVAVAFSFIVSRPLVQQVPPMTMSAFSTGISGLAFFAWGLAATGPTLPDTSAGYIGLVGNSVCYAIGLCSLYAAIHRLGAVRSAILINAEPLVSVAAALLILGQAIAPLQIAGTVVVVAAIVMVQRGDSDGDGEGEESEAKAGG